MKRLLFVAGLLCLQPFISMRAATFVVTSTAASGPGSFDDALLSCATNSPGTNRVTFAIPGTPPFVIMPTQFLNAVYGDTTIDGTTQPGWSNNYPAVVIDGALAGSNGLRCLYVYGSSNLIRGLKIRNYDGSAILFDILGDDGHSSRVEGCHLFDNGYYGVEIMRSSNNVVGGYVLSNRNVISGNTYDGVYVANSSGNVIAGNWIGVTATNSAVSMGGQQSGIGLFDSSGTVVSGSNAAPQVIAGHSSYGIFSSGCSLTTVTGNRIGCDESGLVAVSNNWGGILFIGGASNRVGGSSSTLRNFISGNKGAGVELAGNSDGSVVMGNFLGINAAGSGPLGNQRGVLVNSDASNCVVGGSSGANVISGNLLGGVSVYGKRNRVEGNIIGLAINYSSVVSNGGDGVFVGGSFNTVGGTNAGTGNFISGNERYGVYVNGGPSNVVQGNAIGLDIFGNRRPNQTGVYLDYTSGNVIGGVSSNARNIISGNSFLGVDVEQQASGDFIQGNYIGVSYDGVTIASNTVDGVRVYGGTNITIGGSVPGAGNVIAGSGQYNIYAFAPATGLVIQGNFVGIGADGKTSYWSTGALGRAGIVISASDAIIGGTDTNARNVVAGNGGYGIAVYNATNVVIQGNYIGLGSNGTNAIPNGPYLSSYGVNIGVGATRVTIGGLAAGARNVMAADYAAIYVSGAYSNNIWGNYLGITADGTVAVTGTQYGVSMIAGYANSIGGTNAGAGNVIYAKQSGVGLSYTNSHHNTVQGNLINLGPTGTILSSNVLNGVSVVNAQSNLIGGAVAAARNVIFDSNSGIEFFQSNAVGNVAQGNYIGVGPDGYSPRKFTTNMGTGIDIFLTRGGNTIGGTNAGEGNVIAHHAYGIIVFGSNATRTAIFGNTIYSNVWNNAAHNGIDLAPEGVGADNVSLNDPVPDADIGPNNLQNYPVITNAVSELGSTRVQGYLASSTNARFRIEFFYSDTTNAEGRAYLGATNIVTANNGTGTFSAILWGYAATSKYITATATDTNGNTSEFCPGVIKPSPAIDTDGDGMPDYWESSYALNPNNASDATNSLDGDAVANLAEYIAGTAPNNGTSYLRVSQLSAGSTNIISFPSSQFRNYNLEATTTPTNNAAWSVIYSNVLGSGLTIDLKDGTTTTAEFYRVRAIIP